MTTEVWFGPAGRARWLLPLLFALAIWAAIMAALPAQVRAPGCCTGSASPSAAVLNMSDLLNYTNVMYTVPNRAQFNLSSSIGPPPSLPSQGIDYDYSMQYAVNFTASYFSTPDTNNYTIAVPGSFSNSTYPVEIDALVMVLNLSRFMNGTFRQLVFPNRTGTFYSNSAMANSSSGSRYGQLASIENTTVNGTHATILTIQPIARDLSGSELIVPYHNVVIILFSHGVLGRYNYSYTYSIAGHLLSVLKSHAWLACSNGACTKVGPWNGI